MHKQINEQKMSNICQNLWIGVTIVCVQWYKCTCFKLPTINIIMLVYVVCKFISNMEYRYKLLLKNEIYTDKLKMIPGYIPDMTDQKIELCLIKFQ